MAACGGAAASGGAGSAAILAGGWATLTGLASRADLNGAQAQVLKRCTGKATAGRWKVKAHSQRPGPLRLAVWAATLDESC